jgi:hypothetical protein
MNYTARPGKARWGKAWLGAAAGHGAAMQGKGLIELARVWRGEAGLGAAWPGEGTAWLGQGKAMQGNARRGYWPAPCRGTLLFRKGVGMVMGPIARTRENAFENRKIGVYAPNKETPMFVDEKRQGDLNTWISAPKLAL